MATTRWVKQLNCLFLHSLPSLLDDEKLKEDLCMHVKDQDDENFI